MSDLIRREDAINTLREQICGECKPGEPCDICHTDDLIRAVVEIPPVDAVETRHGRWIIKNSGAYCSECKGKIRIGDAHSYVYCVSQTEKLIKKPRYKICPFCGAHMDGGENDE